MRERIAQGLDSLKDFLTERNGSDYFLGQDEIWRRSSGLPFRRAGKLGKAYSGFVGRAVIAPQTRKFLNR